MMSDKNQKIEDDDFAIDEEEWLDDDLEDGVLETPVSKAPSKSSQGGLQDLSQQGRKKKSGMGLILGGVVVLFAILGGMFFFKSSTSVPPPEAFYGAEQETDQAGGEIGAGMALEEAETGLDNSPPMPTPIDGMAAEETTGLTPDPNQAVPAASAPEVLTPMPDTGNLDHVQLSSLESDAPVLSPSSEAALQSESSVLEEEKLLSATEEQMNALSEQNGSMEPVSPDLDMADVPAAVPEQPAPAADLSSSLAEHLSKAVPPQDTPPAEAPVADLPPAEKTLEIPVVPLAPPETKAVQEEKPAEPVSSEPVKAPEPAKAVEVEEVQAKPVAPSAPAAAPKKAPAPAPSWKLKSALPGSAVIYDPKTGEMKSVEIGDKVAGIGTVRSVEKVNGRWVVQGSAGRVSQ